MGCSNHMTSNGYLFCTMDDSYKYKITLGYDKAIEFECMGAMEVSTREGNQKINDVYYISKVKYIHWN